MSHVPTTSASARQQHLQQAEADFAILPFDADCAVGGRRRRCRSAFRRA
jgi:hypothetical protein